MARTINRLSDRVVKSLTSPGHHHDGGGLYLQISKSGARSWVFRFASPTVRYTKGKRAGKHMTRDMGLGSALLVPMAEARARAAECRAMVAKRIDPIVHSQTADVTTPVKAAVAVAPASGPTFREFAEQYVEAHLAEWRSKIHRAQWSSTLRDYAFPIIGDLPLAGISTADVLRVLAPIWTKVPETAHRVRGRIESVLAAASAADIFSGKNPAVWKGHLQKLLSKKPPSTPFAAMPFRAVPAFMVQLAASRGVSARALEFTILTGARSGQTRHALWQEIDEQARVWSVPGTKMKSGRPHAVPLSDQAIAVLAAVKPLRDLGPGLVFPNATRRPLSDVALSKLVHDLGHEFTPHGFRSALKTWAEEETNHHNVVIESALAHVGDKLEKSYLRGDAPRLEKRRRLMEEWGAYCASAPASNVVSIDRTAA